MPSSKTPLILIVEDELMIATTLDMLLRAKGYRVLGPAATVDQALAALAGEQPDAAVIDYRLARGTTEALLEALEDKGVPVCVTTGYGRDQLPAAYLRHAVVEKPISAEELIRQLTALVE